jgi:formate dehydrogenase maturation protein FdhE
MVQAAGDDIRAVSPATGRGGPGEFGARLARAHQEAPPGAEEPLSLLRRVLTYQRSRAEDPAVAAAADSAAAPAASNLARERFPLLDLDASRECLMSEVVEAVTALTTRRGVVPEPLASAGMDIVGWPEEERRELVSTWLDDASLVDSRVSFWIRVAAAPVLELAAAPTGLPSRDHWVGGACPLCGGLPQVSVIAEESGEFMAGSPRSLVCERCASWWAFPRAVCPTCREDDSRRLSSYVADGRRWVRIDSCESCHSYSKTFDLRDPRGAGVVPLVDDVATLALDLWAHHRGLHRPALSLAGV